MIKIFIFGFILRLIPFLYVSIYHPEGVLFYDSYSYLNIADNLIDHQVFSQAADGQSLIPDIARTPVFPFLLVLLKLISGNILWISFVLLLVGSLNVLLTYKIALQVTVNEKIALISACLVAVDIPSIFFSSIILTETVFTTLLLLMIYFLIKKELNLKWALLVGLFMSLLILCRPIAIYLPVAISLFFLWKRKALKSTITFMVSSYFLVAFWSVRNYQEFNTINLSSVSSTNLYMHTSASIIVETSGISHFEAQQQLRSEFRTEFNGQDRSKEMGSMIRFCNRKAIGYIFEHPVIFVKQYTIGLIYFFIKPIRHYIDGYLGTSTVFYSAVAEKNVSSDAWIKLKKETSLLTIILVIIQLLFIGFMLIGILVSVLRSGWNKELILFMVILAYFALLSSITDVDGRFRIPVVPFMAVLAMVGWSKLMSKKFEHQ
ncbi:MAG: glycosyltransferase family 39 protein [Crocinitomicaceae bacterium]|nr:glycosyltransferase family 39 protein [Crocinitomicaceae bacterium]